MPAYRARVQVGKRQGETIIDTGSMAHAAKVAVQQVVNAQGGEPEQITLVISATPTQLTWAEEDDDAPEE